MSGTDESTDESQREYPKDAGIQIAAQSESRRYHYLHPDGGVTSTPAMSVEQGRQLVADEYPSYEPEDFEHMSPDELREWRKENGW